MEELRSQLEALPMDGALTQERLADHLKVDPTTIYRNRKKGVDHFSQWSRLQDPDDIAWEYDSKTKKFYPLD